MSSGKSVAFAGVALLLATGGLVSVALSVNEPRPVDVRRVDASPLVPGVLSASYTTAIQATRPTTAVVIVPPPQPPRPLPAPPTTTVAPTTTEPSPTSPPSSSVPEETTTSSSAPASDENCSPEYVTDGPCVPRRFPRGVWRKCEWLYDQGTTRIEVVGWDHHGLDRDHDDIACEQAD
ncbi:hypothetical protein [Saccharothrix sp. NRRL B-16314]|uniref:hypothetical protein n=1 Tax=Saccharothrix sp. NRRL B-16314 TaxID=1463825 RepID=UPI000526D44F|nr:hypothetical protein [Saccharothrix sp. NRRL B-16314]